MAGLNELYLELFMIDNAIIIKIMATVGIIWFIKLYNFLVGIEGNEGCEAIFFGITGYLLFGNLQFVVLIS